MSVQEERIVEIPLTESPTPPLVTTEVDELFNESLQELKGRIVDKEVNAATLMIILRVSMEIVEATRLKGADQKELAKKAHSPSSS